MTRTRRALMHALVDIRASLRGEEAPRWLWEAYRSRSRAHQRAALQAWRRGAGSHGPRGADPHHTRHRPPR